MSFKLSLWTPCKMPIQSRQPNFYDFAVAQFLLMSVLPCTALLVSLYCTALYMMTWCTDCDKRRDIRWNIAWAQGKSRVRSLRDFPRDLFHRISWLESQYRHFQWQIQHWPSWEINIRRVDSLCCSDSWAIRENITQRIEEYGSVKFQYYNV